MTDTTPTYADWQALADKEVKGRDLTWNTPEGIAVKPLYTSADAPEGDPGVPGIAPFTRGALCLDVYRPSLDDPAICGLLDRRGIERLLSPQPRDGAKGAVGRFRPRHPSRL